MKMLKKLRDEIHFERVKQENLKLGKNWELFYLTMEAFNSLI
jgi:hypothetical protein